MIVFKEINHAYTWNDVKLRSCTTEIGKYFSKFDPEYQSLISALKEVLGDDTYKRLRKEVFGYNYKPEEFLLEQVFFPLIGETDLGPIREQFKQKWEDSGTKGTAFHLVRENESIENGFEKNPFNGKDYKVITFEKQFDNQVYDMDLSKLEDGYYPELLVYDKALPIELTVCGQIDRLWIDTVDGVRYVYTDDYKTNTTMDKGKFSRCKAPLSHLWSNSFTKYELQASWYHMMLQSHGYTSLDAAFTHYTDYDVNKSVRYPVIIKKKEIELLRQEIMNDGEVFNV